MAPKYNLQHATEDYPFMACLVKVNTHSNWQKTVAKVLNKCHGIYSFRMDYNGLVEISGTADPTLLLKMLGKSVGKAALQWLQFGVCSCNLFMPMNHVTIYGGTTYPLDGRYLHPGNLSRPNLNSSRDHHQITYDHMHDYDQYHNHHYQPAYENQNNHGYKSDGEDMGCCTVM